MNWPDLIAKLRQGTSVSFRPHGDSMTGRISSGQLVTVAPVTDRDDKTGHAQLQTLQDGDIVLCKVRGRYMVHLISAIRNAYPRQQFQISNNKGHVNGWISANGIFGKVIRIDP